jgi:hypothetical protein
MSRRIALLAAILATCFASSPRAQQPTFKSGVDLIRLDVHVVSDDGTPVKDLTADDFDVKANGNLAPVRALQFHDVVATVLAGRQLIGAVEREIIIGQER